jgi:hypothetical protein
MTREEEIRQEMSKIAGTHPDWSKNDCMRMGFYEGAKWADEGMLKKSREWVKNAFVGPFGEGLANSIADEFVKAIKGE